MTTDLELAIHRRTAGGYSVELRFSHAGSDADVRYTAQADFDFERLRQFLRDPIAYGRCLSESLFADTVLLQHFAHARSTALALKGALQLRLCIGTSAAELHSLRWETLRNPHDDSPLATDEHILFSRYLESQDWQHVRVPTCPDLRALVVIANPTDVSDYAPDGQALAPIDVPGELERARSSLGAMPITALFPSPRTAATEFPTLAALTTHLRDGHHILYLVAHGKMIDGIPCLWLQEDQGMAAVVSGSNLVSRLKAMQQRPLLIVLASCESSGTGEQEPPVSSLQYPVSTALGPQLAEAGIPAVLAMQGNISMQTVADFMPRFFRELQRDGQIDRAMAAARGAVRERPDWWMPALFLRVRNGRLWEGEAVQGEQSPAAHIQAGTHTAQVFFCYAPDDRKQVESWYRQLQDAGLNPWMESKDMLGGQVRESVTQQTIRESDFLLVFLTRRAINTSGPFHKALRQALDVWQEKPEGHIYLVPLRLEDCKIPFNLHQFQTIDLFEEDGWERLLRTLQAGIERLHPPRAPARPS